MSYDYGYGRAPAPTQTYDASKTFYQQASTSTYAAAAQKYESTAKVRVLISMRFNSIVSGCRVLFVFVVLFNPLFIAIGSNYRLYCTSISPSSDIVPPPSHSTDTTNSLAFAIPIYAVPFVLMHCVRACVSPFRCVIGGWWLSDCPVCCRSDAQSSGRAEPSAAAIPSATRQVPNGLHHRTSLNAPNETITMNTAPNRVNHLYF